MAALCEGDDGRYGVSVAIFEAEAADAKLRVVPTEPTSALVWLRDSHQLLLVGKGQLTLLDADTGAAQLSAKTGLPASGNPPAMAVSPDGAAVVLLSSAKTPGKTVGEATLSVFSTASLSKQGSTSWQLPSSASTLNDEFRPVQRTTVHVSPVSVAACTSQVGTHVFGYSAGSSGQLGAKLFFARGLQAAVLSADGSFVAGIKNGVHVVLDGLTGTRCFELPALCLEKGQPPAVAVSIAWGVPGKLLAGFV